MWIFDDVIVGVGAGAIVGAIVGAGAGVDVIVGTDVIVGAVVGSTLNLLGSGCSVSRWEEDMCCNYELFGSSAQKVTIRI
jgi:hypothetical protein